MTITLRPTAEQEALLESVMLAVNQSTKTKTLMHVLSQHLPMVEQIEALTVELEARNKLLRNIKESFYQQDEAKQLLKDSLKAI